MYVVPTDTPEADGTLAWDSTSVVVVEVRAGGWNGLGWSYSGTGAATLVGEKLADVVRGADAMAPPQSHEAMVRAVRNMGRPGLAACAISAVDTALWDLKARLLGISLSDLFGRCVDEVRSMGAGGLPPTTTVRPRLSCVTGSRSGISPG